MAKTNAISPIQPAIEGTRPLPEPRAADLRAADTRAARGTTAPSQPAANAQPNPQSVAEQAAQVAAPDLMRDVEVRYQLDPEKGNMTLLLIDKQSRKLIRTVPAEEMTRLGFNHTFDITT